MLCCTNTFKRPAIPSAVTMHGWWCEFLAHPLGRTTDCKFVAIELDEVAIVKILDDSDECSIYRLGLFTEGIAVR